MTKRQRFLISEDPSGIKAHLARHPVEMTDEQSGRARLLATIRNTHQGGREMVSTKDGPYLKELKKWIANNKKQLAGDYLTTEERLIKEQTVRGYARRVAAIEAK